jgi:hypothetical protein
MINEKSLENLKAPKNKKEGYGYRYSIPQEKVDELFTYLAEGSSLKAAAKQAKICFETARKYYQQGDDKRGIKPLKFRLTILQDKISEKFNVLLEERRMEHLDIIKNAITSLKNKINEGDLLNKPNLNHLDKLIRLEVFLMGGVTNQEHEQKMLTAESIGGDNPEGA